jgi:hypothetical protein
MAVELVDDALVPWDPKETLLLQGLGPGQQVPARDGCGGRVKEEEAPANTHGHLTHIPHRDTHRETHVTLTHHTTHTRAERDIHVITHTHTITHATHA